MDLLTEIVEHRLPRLLVAGVDYNDVRLVLSRIRKLDEWCAEWVHLGAMHEELGDEALLQSNSVTAGAAFRRAALYYHVGQFVTFADAERKFAVQLRQQAASRKGMAHYRPPAQDLQVPFEGIVFSGNLRVPGHGLDRETQAPCVILTAGADSTKEEFCTLEDEFLVRGLATFSFDGPGQSTTWRHMKLRPDFENAVSAVLDVLCAHPRINAARLGIWGRSFGGYAAPRAAAYEPRLKACISIGGGRDLAPLPRVNKGGAAICFWRRERAPGR
jgi:hypothetical protein